MAGSLNPIAWIEAAAASEPRRIFLTTQGGATLDYGELRAATARIGCVLHTLGVSAGDRVAVQVDKSVDAVLLYLACLHVGAVYVPINVANTPSEVAYFLRDAEPHLAVVRPADLAVLQAVAAEAGVRQVETLGAHGDGSLRQLVNATLAEAESWNGGRSPGAVPGSAPGAAPAAILYTSGTTGRSKGAVLTRDNLGSNAAALAAEWRFTADDVLLHSLPLFHVHGLFVALNTVLAARASLRLLPKFDAATVLALLPAVSVYMGVPTHYTRLLEEPALDRTVAAGMRLFVSGSAPLLAETHRQFLARTGHTILERYGMTETLMITSNPYVGARVPGSVGPPLPGVAVRLAGDSAIGGIEVKGPNVFAGYWRDAEKTRAEFTADGWFKTGDLGRIGADGYVSIVGRAKDLVISGGYNVYPKEVESQLDALEGVRESAVFGVPHADFGEGVTAAVVLEAGVAVTEEQLLRALRATLAPYKIPKRIVCLDELPRNTMGKVQKNVLRARFAALYTGA
jgi:malonyl-CoA/methylmalonyl-CoA synthetase